MNHTTALYESHLHSIPLIGRGKVRDIYEADTSRLLIVASDRLSAFDVILPNAIPGKGKILTEISLFWFKKLQHIIPNHLDTSRLDAFLTPTEIKQLDGRSMLVQKLKPLPVEAVVRGYLIGSGWHDYKVSGSVCGISLPRNLKQAEKLPEAIFTPATKAAAGKHDENIPFTALPDLIGADYARHIQEISLSLYNEAAAYALDKGIIIADTKFEFGIDTNGKLILIDEVLTPDSSRFWPVDRYKKGISPPSFDKQFVRDYLQGLDWNKQAPGPHLPNDIIEKTAEKYQEALTRLTS